MFQSWGTISGLIYQSVGKTDVQLKMGLLNTAIIFITLLSCIQFGLYAVTVGYAVVSILWVHFSMGIVCRVIRLRYGFVYWSLLPSFAISAVLLVSGVFLKNVIVASDWVEISIVSSVFMMMFVIMLFYTSALKIEDGKLKFNLL